MQLVTLSLPEALQTPEARAWVKRCEERLNAEVAIHWAEMMSRASTGGEARVFGGIRAKRKLDGQGVLSRMRQFYEANPDEDLTFEQIMVKFDATRVNAKSALRALFAEGLVESIKVYRRTQT